MTTRIKKNYQKRPIDSFHFVWELFKTAELRVITRKIMFG